MQRKSLMRRCREATWKKWLGAALVVWLLLAESLAATHPLDQAAHADGQPCAVCVGAASFGAAAVSEPLSFALSIAAAVVAVAATIAFVSAVPMRRYARGPPVVSFTF
jgi:hypothetical protein